MLGNAEKFIIIEIKALENDRVFGKFSNDSPCHPSNPNSTKNASDPLPKILHYGSYTPSRKHLRNHAQTLINTSLRVNQSPK